MHRALGGLDPEQCVPDSEVTGRWLSACKDKRRLSSACLCLCILVSRRVKVLSCVLLLLLIKRREFFVKTFIRSKFKTYTLSGTSGKNRPASYFHPSRHVSPAVCGFTQEEGGASVMHTAVFWSPHERDENISAADVTVIITHLSFSRGTLLRCWMKEKKKENRAINCDN